MQGVKVEAGPQAGQYKRLLDALNDVAHHEIEAWLTHHHHLSEPFVARSISRELPAGVQVCAVFRPGVLHYCPADRPLLATQVKQADGAVRMNGSKNVKWK